MIELSLQQASTFHLIFPRVDPQEVVRTGPHLRFQEILWSLLRTQRADDLREERRVISFPAAVELKVESKRSNQVSTDSCRLSSSAPDPPPHPVPPSWTYRPVESVQNLDGSVFAGGPRHVHRLDVRRVVEVDQLLGDLRTAGSRMRCFGEEGVMSEGRGGGGVSLHSPCLCS